MKCEGNFVYKGLGEKKAGKFTNAQGHEISYKATNYIKLDEILDNNKVVDRVFKFPLDNIELRNKFEKIELYSNVIVTFDIEIYGSNTRLVVTDVVCEQE